MNISQMVKLNSESSGNTLTNSLMTTILKSKSKDAKFFDLQNVRLNKKTFIDVQILINKEN